MDVHVAPRPSPAPAPVPPEKAGRPGPRVPAPVAAAAGLAWAAAIAAHAWGLGDRFHHDAVVREGGLPDPVAVAGFGALWTLMVMAMMLPSTVPLLRLFGEASARQDRPGVVLSLFVAGYLVVWSLAGWVALGLDGLVHSAADAVPWLASRPGMVVAAALALAGAFQFSGLKDRCLTECRHPAAYLLRHYRRGPSAAFRLGWGHGLYCLGCCWALMLVMFAVGVTDLRLMAVLGALMAYEKVGRHGRGVAAVAGVAAMALAGAVAVHPPTLDLLL